MFYAVYFNKLLYAASAFSASALSITLTMPRTWLIINHPNKHFGVTLVCTTKPETKQNITL